jgi:OPA family glycerol-3-phosphate transporter-like MFS transporter/OPA family sugar phosphate sensor protein UhpC-like MFS transporter
MSIEAPPQVDSRPGLFRWFRPDPPAAVRLSDPEQIRRGYGRYQLRVLLWATVGYALFYFVRKNLSIAMPVMSKQLGIGKPELGMFLTLHGVLYGVSKFANGFLGDRANARTFLAAGLILSALCNVFFGVSSVVVIFGIAWMLNGWFQGMGSPPCSRLMSHWFAPRELATKMSIWNTSHSVGTIAAVVLCGYLAEYWWRLCFLVPAGMAVAGAVAILLTLPDTPVSVGLPDVEGSAEAAGDHRPTDDLTDDRQSGASFQSFVRRHVFGNPWIWVLGVANFFVYTVRYSVLDWGPTLLNEAKGIKLSSAGWMMAAYEGSGMVGMLVAGWVTDRVFGGRGARTCLVWMIGCVGATGLLWVYPGRSIPVYTGILCLAGFFIYGPQALVGIHAANLATKRAAATAIGFTGLFGYASTVLSGVGLGMLVERYGWDKGFIAIVVISGMGAVCFAFAWGARAHGYAEEIRMTKPE